MPGPALADCLRHLCRAAARGSANETADADLLARFVSRRDEAAFEALVRRHGPMVLGVCRQLLYDLHEAEDAFQATFLVLVHKAAGLREPALLGNWLYGVAYRIAARARARAVRRRARERQGVEMIPVPASDETGARDLRPVLHEELNRLPAKYRAPLVLCYFQGKTNEEAARQLRWPLGTVKGNLARARELLRVRLSRRGLALSAGGVAAALSQTAAPAAVPAALVGSTVRAAVSVAAGQAAAGLISGQVTAMTRGVLQTMLLTRLTVIGSAIAGVVAAATAAGLLTNPATSAAPAGPQQIQPQTLAERTPGRTQDPKHADSEAEDRRRCADNMKTLGAAMHEHVSTYGLFPPAAVAGKDGKPLLSWRVLLLPFLKEDQLFSEFKLDEPWDSPHNQKLLARMPKVYAPIRRKAKEPFSTFYQVLSGPGTVFEGTRPCRITDITDGTSGTILLIEAAEAMPWTKPADLPYDPQKPLPKFGGTFRKGFYFVTADGAVHFGRTDFDEKLMRAAITRNGEEIVDIGDLSADRKP